MRYETVYISKGVIKGILKSVLHNVVKRFFLCPYISIRLIDIKKCKLCDTCK